MILLDTNVPSALMRDPPDAGVIAWLDGQVPEEVWTTAVNAFEVRFGLSRLPDGRRRRALKDAFEGLLREDLAGRVAALDAAAATEAGRLAARRLSAGRAVDVRQRVAWVADRAHWALAVFRVRRCGHTPGARGRACG